jgi:hypothetical protein
VGGRFKLERPAHRRYFVVITRGEPHWWDRFLAPGKTHCALLIWDEFVYLYLNPTLGITEVSLVTTGDAEFAPPEQILAEDPDAVIVEAELEWDEGMRAPWIWAPVTCVEIVKSALGIRRFWLWTPLQLERYLRSRPWARTSPTS